jgi:arylsulfatase A-like enzyme
MTIAVPNHACENGDRRVLHKTRFATRFHEHLEYTMFRKSIRSVFVAALSVIVSVGVTPAQEKPNIVIILLDDTGFADIGAYGSEISTPNIDALAASGVRFTNFHTAATCSPTRSMLLTGVDNHLTGMGNMLEIMADNQFDQPGYEAYMTDSVVTTATLLKDAGYHTYMAGKWHLGKKKGSLPASRGFERSIALMESGADNWEKKTYLPMYDFVHFYEGTEETDLPEDFFSTDYYIDRIKEYIGKDKGDGKPFFAYVSLQAQHYPLQAPQKYIDKYKGVYDVGWDEIRARRYEKQVALGVMPAGLKLPPIAGAPEWESLSAEERRVQAKKMMVYAGMLDNVDANIGRLMSYLKEIGEDDNTVVVVMSDNGADNNEQDKIFPEWYAKNFDLSYERMGLKGSYTNYGPGWAGASSTPLNLFKASASEGGMRVPFIVNYPRAKRRGVTTGAFAYVTDITPTLLELAGVQKPAGSYGGREVHPITGKSMLSFLRGEQDEVHGPRDVVAYELAGSAAVFRGNHKLMRNNPPFGDKQWRLYRTDNDAVEASDLASAEPELLAELSAAYDRYAREVNLIEVPDDYNPLVQVQKNAQRNQGEEATDEVPVLD